MQKLVDQEALGYREVQYEAECGCWCKRSFAPDGELLELHILVCESHMMCQFDTLDLSPTSDGGQLTLSLPSPEDGRAREA